MSTPHSEMTSPDPFKSAAQAILKRLRETDPAAKLAQAYDFIALAHGHESWHVMAAARAIDLSPTQAPATPSATKKDRWVEMLRTATRPADDMWAPHVFLCADIRAKLPTNTGEGVIQERALQMLAVVLEVLFWRHKYVVSLPQIKEALTTQWIVYQAIHIRDVPPNVSEKFLAYLRNLAGFPQSIIGNLNISEQIAEQTNLLSDDCRTQHGRMTQQLSLAFAYYRKDAVFDFTKG
jgi:hypothetical protein